MDHQAITVDEFARAMEITKQAALSHADELKRQGAYLNQDGTLLLPYGTRKHFNLGRTKLGEPGKRYYTILKATSAKCYVDAHVINVLPEEFDAMIRALVAADLLIPSGVANEHGANGYICSPKAEFFLEDRAHKATKEILEVIGAVVSAGGLATQVVAL